MPPRFRPPVPVPAAGGIPQQYGELGMARISAHCTPIPGVGSGFLDWCFPSDLGFRAGLEVPKGKNVFPYDHVHAREDFRVPGFLDPHVVAIWKCKISEKLDKTLDLTL